MTTVAVRERVFASDSRVTSGKNFIESDDTKKLFSLGKGCVCGFAGDLGQYEPVVEILTDLVKKDGDYLPKLSRRVNVLFGWDRLYSWDGNYWETMKDDTYAIGSGSAFAIPILDAGLSAKKAVEIGIKRDCYSGGPIQTMKWKYNG